MAEHTGDFENEFRREIERVLGAAPETIIMDGNPHRFPIEGHKGKPGFYIGRQGPPESAIFGNWAVDGGAYHRWPDKPLEQMTAVERKQAVAQREKDTARWKKARAELNTEARQTAKTILKYAKPANANHSYLVSKGIRPHGIFTSEKGDLVIPLRNVRGELQSLEFIREDGSKKLLFGGAKKGNFHRIKKAKDAPDTIYIVEGYGTGASVFGATGCETVVAFDAGNLLPVGMEIRKVYPKATIVFCADDDRWTKGNPGIKFAKAAAKATGAFMVSPVFKNLQGKKLTTDFNDLHQREGLEEVRRQVFGEKWVSVKKESKVTNLSGAGCGGVYVREYPPIMWAVRGIIASGVSLFAGKPKHGKSALVLNIAITIATGGKALGVIDVKPGTVLYFALEDTERRVQTRLRKMYPCGDVSLLDNIRLYTRCPPMDDGGLDALDGEIAKYPDTRLVIIDTLKMFRPSDTGKKSIYDKDYDPISQVKTVADKHNVPILFVHHVRKGEAEEIFDTVSGSFGLTGAVDTIMVLERKSNKTDAVLHIQGRDVQLTELALRFYPDTFSWILRGDAHDVQDSEEQQQLYDFLKDETDGKAMGPTEVAKRTGLNASFVKRNLLKFSKHGIVERIDGLYRLLDLREVPVGELGALGLKTPFYE